MFEELSEPKAPLWKRLRWTPNVVVLLAMALIMLLLPAYNFVRRGQLEREGAEATGRIERATQHRSIRTTGSWLNTWSYSFEVNRKRYHGSWTDTSAQMGPKIGDPVVVSYLRSDPNVNHHGHTDSQEIDGLDIKLIVGGLIATGFAFYLAIGE